jgi:two-component system sensor histidine kinase AlgZ
VGLARNYLGIEQVRFGDRLHVQMEIEDSCTECAVPSLLLQPLVENAVKHGIAGLLEGGTIHLRAWRNGRDVIITIENGFDPEAPPRRSMGMGLQHVRRRLQVRFGGQASFDARADGASYRVSLRFPCESPIASSSRA